MSGHKIGKFGICSNAESLQRLAIALHRIHPNKTAAAVEADINVPADTVRKWLRLESSPNLQAFAKLVFFYGPEVLSAVYAHAPGWLNDAVRTAKIEHLTQQQEAAQRAIEELR